MKAADGSLPIHYAAAKGSIDVIELLLDQSTDAFKINDQVNAIDNENQTPLHRAAQKGREAVSYTISLKNISIN